jgi:hypothetical protein
VVHERELVGVAHRQRTQQQRVDQAEDRRVDAHGEGEDEDADQSKRRTLRQRAQTVAKVSKHR